MIRCDGMIDGEMSDRSNPVQSHVLACFAKNVRCVCVPSMCPREYSVFPPSMLRYCFRRLAEAKRDEARAIRRGERKKETTPAPPTPKLCPCLRLQEMMMCGDIDGSIKIEIGRPCRAKKVPMVLLMLRPGQQRSLRMQKRPKQAQAGCQAKKR